MPEALRTEIVDDVVVTYYPGLIECAAVIQGHRISLRIQGEYMSPKDAADVFREYTRMEGENT